MKGIIMSAEATAAFLRELLNQPPPRGRYRALWVDKTEKLRKGEVSQAAVARVITEYLASKGEPPVDPRTLRSLISRALAGTQLTKETLGLFIESFDMAERDAQKLWMLFMSDISKTEDRELADWTADPRTGRSNSSPAFQKAVEGVATLIKRMFPEKKSREVEALAGVIVAHLAHNEHLGPRGDSRK